MPPHQASPPSRPPPPGQPSSASGGMSPTARSGSSARSPRPASGQRPASPGTHRYRGPVTLPRLPSTPDWPAAVPPPRPSAYRAATRRAASGHHRPTAAGSIDLPEPLRPAALDGHGLGLLVPAWWAGNWTEDDLPMLAARDPAVGPGDARRREAAAGAAPVAGLCGPDPQGTLLPSCREPLEAEREAAWRWT